MDRIAHSVPGTAAPLAMALQAVRDAASDHRRQRHVPNPRRPVRAIDLLLDDLERLNLAGGAPLDSVAVTDWLDHVQAAVGFAIPDWVLAVPDTARLHAAMLRWQGTLLTTCRPEREQMGDVHDDPLDLLVLASHQMRGQRTRVRRQVA